MMMVMIIQCFLLFNYLEFTWTFYISFDSHKNILKLPVRDCYIIYLPDVEIEVQRGEIEAEQTLKSFYHS